MHAANLIIPSPNGRQILAVIAGFILLLIIAFCVFYLAHTHQYLAAWFRGLDSCFYRNSYWESDFFLPAVKQHGNLICWAGIGVSLFTGFLIFRPYRKRVVQAARPLIVLSQADIIYLGLLITVGVGMWVWAHQHILPYMDEVFSAIHCAEGHPMQTLSYYMLPNNHVFFNLLNNVLFYWADDHVFTGRIVSGMSFLGLLLLLYCWCRQIMKHRLLAFLATLAIAVHFQVWGFGAMGRGYELYLLCEWLAFISIWQYARTNERFWLRTWVIAIIIGFATLPTYLFFFAALMMMAIVNQAYKRKLDIRFWRYTAIAMAGVFLFYLPSLTFSGLHAYVANEYVAPKELTLELYLPIAQDKIREAIVYCFTGSITLKEDFYLIFGVVPIVSFLLFRNKKSVFIAVFFTVMWGTLFIISCQLRQFAFLRNLIGHLSFTYAFVIITVFLLLKPLLQIVKLKRAIVIVFPVFLGLFFYHFIKMAEEQLARTLYHFDINRYGELLEMDLRDLPQGANVAFSDESFYLLYLSRKKGFVTKECGDGTDEYYIKIDSEALPKPPAGHYQLMWERGDYRIYQRKD